MILNSSVSRSVRNKGLFFINYPVVVAEKRIEKVDYQEYVPLSYDPSEFLRDSLEQ